MNAIRSPTKIDENFTIKIKSAVLVSISMTEMFTEFVIRPLCILLKGNV